MAPFLPQPYEHRTDAYRTENRAVFSWVLKAALCFIPPPVRGAHWADVQCDPQPAVRNSNLSEGRPTGAEIKESY
jgi:hypothetical protein